MPFHLDHLLQVSDCETLLRETEADLKTCRYRLRWMQSQLTIKQSRNAQIHPQLEQIASLRHMLQQVADIQPEGVEKNKLKIRLNRLHNEQLRLEIKRDGSQGPRLVKLQIKIAKLEAEIQILEKLRLAVIARMESFQVKEQTDAQEISATSESLREEKNQIEEITVPASDHHPKMVIQEENDRFFNETDSHSNLTRLIPVIPPIQQEATYSILPLTRRLEASAGNADGKVSLTLPADFTENSEFHLSAAHG